MNHADWLTAMRRKIARLRQFADHTLDDEVKHALVDIAAELEAEVAFIDQKYGRMRAP